MVRMEKYFDKFGMIAQNPPQRDGGDSCQRMGMYYFGLWVRSKLKVSNATWYKSNDSHLTEMIFGSIMDSEGKLRRHPDPDKWYSTWDNASRDQSIPFVVACGVTGNTYALSKFFWNHLTKRLLLKTTNTIPNWVYPDGDERCEGVNYELKNKWEKIKFYFGWRPKDEDGDEHDVYARKMSDFTGPEFWALYIRAFRAWYLYPFLLIFDAFTVFGAVGRRFSKSNDVLNHCIISANMRFRYPTPWSFLVNYINNWASLYLKMHKYFNKYESGISDMADLWKPICVYMGGFGDPKTGV